MSLKIFLWLVGVSLVAGTCAAVAFWLREMIRFAVLAP